MSIRYVWSKTKSSINKFLLITYTNVTIEFKLDQNSSGTKPRSPHPVSPTCVPTISPRLGRPGPGLGLGQSLNRLRTN